MKNLINNTVEQALMRNMQLTFLVAAALLLSFSSTYCQVQSHEHMQRCHTDETYEEMILTHPEYAKNRKIIEREMQAIINNPNREQNLNGIITIPVVYHVIHDGDAVGTNENLSVALLQAQLDQMTDDFRRLNSDANNTPSDFTGVAADSEIEFCLTTIDPAGLAATGIERHHINTFTGVNLSDCWTGSYINSKIKPSTIWDRDKYLNVWTVVKINKTSNCANTILGYAQFPGGGATTDGIVLRASTVGSIAMPNPAGGNFDQGRTGTHEVGHYLNLIHIWGDGGCSVDDLVGDTPTAGADNNTGSPCTYPGPNSCIDATGDLPDMFQNYMDYSDDQCMNLFTAGQKTRMHAAITASRPGLITSACGATPVNDLMTNAINIDCNTAQYSGTTIDATSSDAPANCGTTIDAPGVWYTMAGMHADVTLDLCQAPYDSQMNIYEENGNGGLICIDGEDDDTNNCSGNDPYITFASEIGKTYYIYVQGFNGQTGTFDLNVSCDCYNEVVNTNDNGPGSLRDVIACAADGDIITFDPAIDGQNIMLTSGQIVIDKSLTIQGNGIDNTIIDGAMDDVSRIFDISNAGTATVQIEGLTIQNGGSPTSTNSGGAIITNADLNIVNVKFKNNQTTGYTVSAIYTYGGSTNISNCLFEDNINHNPSSGASTIWTQGDASLTVNQCLFTGNIGDNLIYGFNTSFLEITNNTTYNNTMNNHIFAVANNEVHIDNNVISELGSALYLGSGITTSTITNNLSGASDPELLASDGNIVGDPLFVDAAGGDFNLDLNSPCFNTANPAQLPADVFDIDGDSDTSEPIPTDLSGTRSRVISGAADMGAFERIPDVCEDTYPVLCGETLTEDITGYIVNFGCGDQFNSKIHEFTAASDGIVTIDLNNFTDDKDIYLYDDLCGLSCNALASSISTSITEQIIYNVTNGTTYHIEVFDRSETGGSYDLSLSCVDCNSDLVFTSPTDDITSGVEDHSTDENITSDIVISGTGTDVTYSAGIATGKSISLNNGFCVELGAAFEANLTGCTTSTFAPNTSNNNKQLMKRTKQSKRKARN